MHPFAMKTAAILVHSLYMINFCCAPKMAIVVVAKQLLCRHYDITLHTEGTHQGIEYKIMYLVL